MTSQILLYMAAFFTTGWGIAHMFPTRNVVAGFGDISKDNRRIITMEWIAEGLLLITIGLMVGVVTVVGSGTAVATAVYLVAVTMLAALTAVTLFTGFKINFLPFKLCVPIFVGSALLLLLGIFL